jgi:putative SOS response-associated peptidase YedK
MKKLPTLKELEGKYEPEELKDLTDEEVLKVFEGVETIWDFEPTDREIEIISLNPVDKVEHFKEWGYNPETYNQDLRELFLIRDNDEMEQKYFKRLSKKNQENILEHLNHGDLYNIPEIGLK